MILTATSGVFGRYRVLGAGRLAYDGTTLRLVTAAGERPVADAELSELKPVSGKNSVRQCDGYDLFVLR
ncbi:MAG TPA: hypothetical protein VF796_02370 [Humisphaera sp.]